MNNCNYCKHLNLTEEEQKKIPGRPPHRCNEYNERLFHRTNRKGHIDYIFPCSACAKDGFEKFEVR